jgi:hypothetical protein
MPFTLAHPVAVLPLRRFLPLSALFFGSMSPDLEFPLRLAAVTRFSHTLPAILYFCIPAGMLLLAVWHWLVKRPAILLLPDGVRQRIEPMAMEFRYAPAGRLLLVGLAAGIGALSHITWDSFTHDYGWMVGKWDLLSANLGSIDGHELRVYKLLQWGSSVAGMLLLALLPLRRPGARSVTSGPLVESIPGFPRRRLAAAIIILTLAFSSGMGWLSALQVTPSSALRAFATQLAVSGMISFSVCMLIYSLLMRIASRDRGRPAPTLRAAALSSHRGSRRLPRRSPAGPCRNPGPSHPRPA